MGPVDGPGVSGAADGPDGVLGEVAGAPGDVLPPLGVVLLAGAETADPDPDVSVVSVVSVVDGWAVEVSTLV